MTKMNYSKRKQEENMHIIQIQRYYQCMRSLTANTKEKVYTLDDVKVNRVSCIYIFFFHSTKMSFLYTLTSEFTTACSHFYLPYPTLHSQDTGKPCHLQAGFVLIIQRPCLSRLFILVVMLNFMTDQ